ncbi:MAG: hypothetical protein M0Z65_09245 [Firmicutes bacterium]|uniref:Uncharacterized protein n=1 Tax=Melghirimyces thermohalophilus TaxID=1236220 RepID=A0A1G6MW34_9BACL|nr:hypothetical protein [Melghirimyces thermohalophilus]MDA8353347.1 hypothetical protein [Bacillota bacterium]SDC59417.1 hypothetical protein SAMN04488112_1112 [Melghirimyces thermohalophilus]
MNLLRTLLFRLTFAVFTVMVILGLSLVGFELLLGTLKAYPDFPQEFTEWSKSTIASIAQ